MEETNMKAIVCTKYGSPADLEYKEVTRPTPGEGEVLVKVHASSVNDWDWGLIRGRPIVLRLSAGLMKPREPLILGCDIAGTVESVGKNVKRFKPGDEVYGDTSESGFGGFAEYLSTSERSLAPKPVGMTFEQAAAVPHAGALAVQGLFDKGQLKPDQKVLFNGAGGGVGTLGLQLAKSIGAEVTCVDSGPKLGMLRSLGADHVIDYTKEDFTENGLKYDVILDNVVSRSLFHYKRALSAGGRYVMIGGKLTRIISIAITAPMISRSKKMSLLVLKPNNGLERIIELFNAGRLEPVIDRTFPLSSVPEAFELFGNAAHKGKIIIQVTSEKRS